MRGRGASARQQRTLSTTTKNGRRLSWAERACLLLLRGSANPVPVAYRSLGHLHGLRPALHPAQARFQLWTFGAFNSIYANCTPSTAPDGGVPEAVAHLLRQQQQDSSTATISDTATTSNTTTSDANAPDDPRVALPAAQRFLALQQALAQCAAGPGSNSSAALDRMLSLQPASVRLRSSRQPGLAGVWAGAGSEVDGESTDGFGFQAQGTGGAGITPPSRLRLRAGAPFDVAVQLYDVNGLPVSAGIVWSGLDCLLH